jgi:hypothetical protein
VEQQAIRLSPHKFNFTMENAIEIIQNLEYSLNENVGTLFFFSFGTRIRKVRGFNLIINWYFCVISGLNFTLHSKSIFLG